MTVFITTAPERGLAAVQNMSSYLSFLVAICLFTLLKGQINTLLIT